MLHTVESLFYKLQITEMALGKSFYTSLWCSIILAIDSNPPILSKPQHPNDA